MNNQLKGAVYGLAVADALGVPGEFQRRGTYRIDGMVSGGAHDQPAGTFSDDTSMALACCDSLRCNQGRVDTEDMRTRFRAWRDTGRYAVAGRVFDIGITVSNALSRGRGLDGERSCGNGSLMRIAPLAFAPGVTDDEIRRVSAITHAHPVCEEGCVLYVRLAQQLASGADPRDAVAALPASGRYERLPHVAELDLDAISSSGYIVHTFEAALWALVHTESYRDCALACANMGDDTDTVAAVAGALAGIVYGFDAIPSEWIDALRGHEIIDACLW